MRKEKGANGLIPGTIRGRSESLSRSCYPSLVVASCLLAVAAAADPLGVKLNGPIPPGQSVSTFRLSPDGSRAVFEVGASEQSAIFSVPTAGGAPTPLHPPLDGGLASSAGISPDGTWVVFKARFSPSGPLDTYAVPIEGGPLTLLGGIRASRIASARTAAGSSSWTARGSRASRSPAARRPC